MFEFVLMVAQTSQPAGPQAAPATFSLLMPLLLVGVVFYFLMLRPQSKERKNRAAMIEAIKKNDRVVTIGGIVGTVLMVKDDEVTLKVDESSNTKITFTKSAIARVVSAAPAEGSAAKPGDR